ncbi:MAG: zinc ABC transporter substrate-binding protein [Victivallales bacterium]|nr:zinc ABC transporter substrate-binding protein [Victivallales bacterium]
MKCLALLLTFLAATSLCAEPLRLMVSIAPQVESVRAVAGSEATIGVLVPPGASPETYSPSAKELKRLAETQLLFTIGAPIEAALLPKIKRSFPNVRITDASTGMVFRKIAEDEGHVHHHSHHSSHDPHVWLSIANMKIHSANVLRALSEHVPEQAQRFQGNHLAYIKKLELLSQEIATLMKPKAGSSLMVFHPAFGYFLDEYAIRQISVEADGKQPSPKHLAHLMKLVKEQHFTTLFIQPQTSDNDAQALAKSLGLAVKTLNPLPSEYSAGLKAIAETIAAP